MKRLGRVLADLAIVAVGLVVMWVGVQALLTFAGQHDPFGFLVGMAVAVVGLGIVAVGADATR